MIKEKVLLKRILAAFLCVVMLINEIALPVFAQEEISPEDDDFRIFMADFLVDNYLLESLSYTMQHQVLYEAMKQEFGESNLAVNLTNLANDWDIAFIGKTGYYENVLTEMLVNHINSDLFKINLKNKTIEIENEFFDGLSQVLKVYFIENDLAENADLLDGAAEFKFTTWKDFLAVPVNDLRNATVDFLKTKKIELPLSYVGTATFNFIDVITQAITYYTITQQLDGITAAMDEMYRTTSDSQLQKAISNLTKKLNAYTGENAFINISNLMQEEFLKDFHSDLVKDVFMNFLGVLGLGIDVGGFVSNLTFKSEDLSQIQLLLEVQLEIEKSIKDALKTRQNDYYTSVEKARSFNYLMMFLYDSYEEGLTLADKYSESVFKATNNVITIKSAIDHRYIESHQLRGDNKQTRETFNKLIQTYTGIIASDRTVFESAWLQYKDLHRLKEKDKISSYYSTYVSHLEFADKILTFDIRKDFHITLEKPLCTPDKIAPVLTYYSSDPEVVSVDNANKPDITLRGVGQATITAKTQSGNARAEILINVTDSDIPVDVPFGEEVITPPTNKPKYESAYKENSTGVTLTHFVYDFIDNGVYSIPAYIDNKPVTELSLSYRGFGKEDDDISIDEIEKIVLPSTVKKIADNCFLNLNVEVVLNEGLEEIGDYAFKRGGTDYKNRKRWTLVIPSTVKKIGKGAFRYADVGTVIIKTSLLTEIPDECFMYSFLERIILPEEMPNLERIGKKAFYWNTFFTGVNLPDSVKIIDEFAFAESNIAAMEKLPSSLETIGAGAFAGSNFITLTIPTGVKQLDTNIFDWATFHEVKIPNSTQLLYNSYTTKNREGKHDWENYWDNRVSFYGEAEGNLTIEADSFSEFDTTNIVLPESARIIHDYLGDIENLTWTNGIDEISFSTARNFEDYDNKPSLHRSVYLNEVNYNGNFSFNPQGLFNSECYFDYIEIPVNYLDNTIAKGVTFTSKDWMKDVLIVGKANNSNIDKYIELLKPAIDVGGTISYRDENGNVTPLFEQIRQSYEKESLYKFENSKEYRIPKPEEFENKKSDVIRDKNNRNVMEVTVSYNNRVKSKVGSAPALSIGLWEEESESAEERARQLGNLLIFEDLYLKQDNYRYFTIGLENSDDIEEGEYSVSVNFGPRLGTVNEAKLALYHIGDTGLITRIPIHFTPNYNIISFKTDKLGTFALSQINDTYEKVDSPYIEELHNLLGQPEIEAGYQKPAHFETDKNGNQSFIVEDKDSGDVSVSKPDLDKETENKFFGHFGTEEETTVPTKPENWDKIEDSIVKIDTADKNTVQVALQITENKGNDVHIFKDDETLTDITDESVKEIKAKKADDLIKSDGYQYFNIKLPSAGSYYMAVTEGEKKVIESGQNEEIETDIAPVEEKKSGFGFILPVIVIIVLGVVAVAVINNRKKSAEEE